MRCSVRIKPGKSFEARHMAASWRKLSGPGMCSGSRRAPLHPSETASKYFLWTDSPTKVAFFSFSFFFHLVMEDAEFPLVQPSFCLPFQSRQTEGSRSNCILQDADLHFLLHFDETAAELSASISSPSDLPCTLTTRGVCACIHACLFAYGLSLCLGVCARASFPATCVRGCVCLNCFKVMSLRHPSRQNVYF